MELYNAGNVNTIVQQQLENVYLWKKVVGLGADERDDTPGIQFAHVSLCVGVERNVETGGVTLKMVPLADGLTRQEVGKKLSAGEEIPPTFLATLKGNTVVYFAR